MKNRVIITTFFLLAILIANASDTIFTSLPEKRNWDPYYMQEVFLDEFNGTSLNTNIWYIDQCEGRGYHENNEGEPNNIQVDSGKLKLIVRYEPGNIDSNCWTNTHFVSDYTSTEIWSRWYPYRYKYGCFEAKCLMPEGDHSYYAYWLWGPGGDGFPQDGYTSEVDIAEGVEWSDGSHHKMKSTFHTWPQDGGDQLSLPEDAGHSLGTEYEGEWHVYKIIWSPFEMIFYVDDNEVWRRTRFHTGSDIDDNDVAMNNISTNILYHDRLWFPNDEMATVLQMHIQKGFPIQDLPVAMEVDYVKVKQFFLSPEITCPTLVCSSSSETATLDVDDEATDITWTLSPTNLFTGSTSGTGKTASIQGGSNYNGWGTITYSFEMPSGESFEAQKTFWVGPPDDQYLDMTATMGGDDKLIPGELNQIVASYTGPGEPLIDHNWGSYSGWPHFEVGADHSISFYTVPYNFSTYEDIYASAQNTCGSSPIHTKRFYPLQYFYLSIYPNPANEYIELSIAPENEVQNKTSKIRIEKASGEKDFGEYTIEIRNEDGNLLKSVSSQKTNLQLSTSEFWPGRYFVHLITDGKIYKQQLIIEK